MGFAGGVDSVAGDTVADSKSDSGYSKVNESGGRDAVSRADVDSDSSNRSAANQDAIDRAAAIKAQKAIDAFENQNRAQAQARLEAEARVAAAAAEPPKKKIVKKVGGGGA